MEGNYNPSRFQIFEKKRQRSLLEVRNRREDIFEKSKLLFLEKCNDAHEEESEINENQSNSLDLSEEMTQKSEMIDQSIELQYKRSGEGLSQQIFLKKGNQRTYKGKNKKGKFNFYMKNLFQTPDWMNSVPEDINEFYGAARPAGKTVLILIESHDFAKVYDKLGKKIFSFKIIGRSFKDTILEAFYVQQNQKPKIFVNDMLCWKGNIYSTESFQFRYSWLQSNLNALAQNIFDAQVKLLQYFPMNHHNLEVVYTHNFGYQKEGLSFVHRNSFYLHETNPNSLIWKDRFTSQYPIDQTKDNSIQGTGYLLKDGSVKTLDHFKVNQNALQMIGDKRSLVRFRIKSIIFNELNENNQNDFMRFLEFQVVSIKKQHCSKADPLSRLIFQYRMRYDPLTIENICACMK